MSSIATLRIPEKLPVPKIELRFYPDDESGLNLIIDLLDFEMGPPGLLYDKRKPVGQANLYVNGARVRRIYGPYQHLPRELFKPGANLVKVSLTDHDHQPWLRDGKKVLASSVLDLQSKSLVLHCFSSSPWQ